MTIQRMLELLEIEHECILRNSHNACDRNCADCDLVQDDDELHEMYTDVIDLLKKQEPKPIDYTDNPYTGLPVAHCPNCGRFARQFHTEHPGEATKFCPWCGQEVKWK